jgi:hypothetical protein
MTLRPIIFTAEEVRATLAGKQSQFRRVMKPQPEGAPIQRDEWPLYSRYPIGPCAPFTFPFAIGDRAYGYRCPFGIVGGLLWIRETWAWDFNNVDFCSCNAGDFPCRHMKVFYKADPSTELYDLKWYSPVAMPCRASRLILEITKVWMQRIQEISEEDAKASGALPLQKDEPGCWYTCDVRAGSKMHARTAILAFAKHWDRCNPKHSWASDPWVWVIAFKVAT